jgi:hypothetical protein
LTAATKYATPETSDLVNETPDPATVARHGVVVQPALHDASQPSARFAQRSVHPFSQFRFDRLQCCPNTFRNTVAMDREPTLFSCLAAPMGETKKVKRVRTTLATPCTMLNRIATELDQACLAFVKLQAKPCKALPECFQTRCCLGMTFEANHEIIHESNHYYVAAAMVPPPPFNPKVEHIVQVYIRKKR